MRIKRCRKRLGGGGLAVAVRVNHLFFPVSSCSLLTVCGIERAGKNVKEKEKKERKREKGSERKNEDNPRKGHRKKKRGATHHLLPFLFQETNFKVLPFSIFFLHTCSASPMTTA